jgi:hypothetical protein
LTMDEVERDIQVHGKIVVIVKRGTFDKTKCSGAKLWQGYDEPDTGISSKKVVQDHAVSHAVKYVGLTIRLLRQSC